jgi:predicted nucleic acid-binding Zn ribbon protein
MRAAGQGGERRARIALRRPVAAQQVLGSVLKQYGIDKELARYHFVLRWPEIVGEEIARRTRPECLRKGALVVRVCNSVWAQELSFYKPVILNRLRKYLDAADVVNDLVFYVDGAAPSAGAKGRAGGDD